jgi:hypothetical protein
MVAARSHKLFAALVKPRSSATNATTALAATNETRTHAPIRWVLALFSSSRSRQLSTDLRIPPIVITLFASS